MPEDFAEAMRRATDLTRAGNLDAATQAILQALGGGSGTPQPSTPGAAPRARVGQSLDEVLANLRTARGGTQGGSVVPVPDGATWVWRSHAAPEGTRDYRLYLPASTPAPRGLILMLHGCTQAPDDFALGTGMNAVAERYGLAVAWPSQTEVHNPTRCWNWFRPADQGRSGEAAVLAALTQALATEYVLDRAAVFVAGLSAGGAMAAILTEAYPEVFSAVGIHSGLPTGAATDLPSAMAAMRGAVPVGRSRPARAGQAAVRTIVFHGTADVMVHPSNAQRIVDRARDEAVGAAHVTRGLTAGRGWQRSVWPSADGSALVEDWQIEGAGHAWSGGNAAGSFADPAGPDAAARMVAFFRQDPDPAD